MMVAAPTLVFLGGFSIMTHNNHCTTCNNRGRTPKVSQHKSCQILATPVIIDIIQ